MCAFSFSYSPVTIYKQFLSILPLKDTRNLTVSHCFYPPTQLTKPALCLAWIIAVASQLESVSALIQIDARMIL